MEKVYLVNGFVMLALSDKIRLCIKKIIPYVVAHESQSFPCSA